MNHKVYLDYAATTPLDPGVRDAMLPYLADTFGNASSVHRWGQDARRAIDHARDLVALRLGCSASEVFFTSGGTESDNTALLGVLLAAKDRGRNHLVVSQIEHHAVLDCARFAERELGFFVTYVPVDRTGRVDPNVVAEAVNEHTALVSIMHANNEVGTIQPIAEIAARIRTSGAYLHADAVQTLGQIPFTVKSLGVDLLTISAHKIYGPKGAGALYVREGVAFRPWLYGGQQEREKRAGTENVAAIVGLGEAVSLNPLPEAEGTRLTTLRDHFIREVQLRIPDAKMNGDPAERLPNNANFSFPGCDGATLLLMLDMHGIAASSGSACASGSIEPSHVLLAIGASPDVARSAVRFSLGRATTPEELEVAATVLADCVRAARV